MVFKRRKLSLACMSLLASLQFAEPSLAQQATSTEAPAAKPEGGKNSAALEAVVVSATKRKEDAAKIPLSVTVLTGDALGEQHVNNIADLTRAVPNLSFSGGAQGGGSGLANIELRGISSQAGSSTVSVYLDDVSMTTRNLYSLGSAEPKFFDVANVEVLRGPQGTLYGASSMGGTIKFISNQPNLKSVESSFSAEVSSTDHGGTGYNLSAVYNQPITVGESALRLGVQLGRVGGYIDQVSQADPTKVIATGINSEQSSVFKAALKWAPNAQLSITPSLFYQRVKSEGLDVSHLTDINGNPLPANQTDQLLREPGTDTLAVQSVTVNYDMGGADLTSITSYFARDFNRQQDGQAANSQFLGCCLISDPGLASVVNGLPSAVLLDNSVRQFSQELRVASKGYDGKGSGLTWLGGFYFSSLQTTVTDNEPVFGINAAFSQAGLSVADTNVLSGGFANAFPNDNSYYSQRRYSEKQTALFGEGTYFFNPSVRLTLGARYLQATENFERDGDLYFSAGPNHSAYAADYSAFTPKVAVSMDIDKNNAVFASATKGFRLGGANRAIPQSICGNELKTVYGLDQAPSTFDSDYLWSYEVGSKSRWLDNRVSFNFSAFYVKWSNIQQDVQLNCTYDFEGNFGNATSQGVEMEAKAKITPNLTVGFFGGVTHATFSEDVPAINTKAGDQLQGVPKWNAALTGEYRFYDEGSIGGFVRGAARWVGASRGSFQASNPDYDRPSYMTLDASIGGTKDSWEFSLFVKNLLNDQTMLQKPYVQFLTEAYRQRPRTIGVTLTKAL